MLTLHRLQRTDRRRRRPGTVSVMKRATCVHRVISPTRSCSPARARGVDFLPDEAVSRHEYFDLSSHHRFVGWDSSKDGFAAELVPGLCTQRPTGRPASSRHGVAFLILSTVRHGLFEPAKALCLDERAVASVCSGVRSYRERVLARGPQLDPNGPAPAGPRADPARSGECAGIPERLQGGRPPWPGHGQGPAGPRCCRDSGPAPPATRSSPGSTARSPRDTILDGYIWDLRARAPHRTPQHRAGGDCVLRKLL